MGKPAWLYRPAGVNDRQLTKAEHGHCLATGGSPWSPDSRWIVFDTRSDAAGEVFDADEIQAVHVPSRKTRTLFQTSNDAVCGEASFSPIANERTIVFVHGPENPTGAWTYAPHRRFGALVDVAPRLRGRAKKLPTSKGGASGASGAGAGESESVAADDPFDVASCDLVSDVGSVSTTPTKRPFGGSIAGSLRSSRAAPSSPNNKSNAKPARPRDVSASFPRKTLDARDLLPDQSGRFTAGALRGGTARHVFSPDGAMVASSYEDAVLLRNGALPAQYSDVETNHRAVAVTSLAGGGVDVETEEHPRNHAGAGFTVVASRHASGPSAALGTNEVTRASDACWVGRRGYMRSDAQEGGGGWQGRAVAFLGEVARPPPASAEGPEKTRGARGGRSKKMSDSSARGLPGTHLELFVLDLPADPAALRAAAGLNAPLAGTETTRPRPPRGCAQRRVTRTDRRVFPGVCAGPRNAAEGGGGEDADPCGASKGNSKSRATPGPRFTPRTSPDGRFACVCAMDDSGVPQLYLVRVDGDADGALLPVTRLPKPGVQSAFAWSDDGANIAFVHDGSVCLARAPGPKLTGASHSSGIGNGSQSATASARAFFKRAARGPDQPAPPWANRATRLTRRRFGPERPRPESLWFSPCGEHVAYARRVIRRGVRAPKLRGRPFEDEGGDEDGDGVSDWFNQVCAVSVKPRLRQPFRAVKRFVDGGAAGIVAVVTGVAAHHSYVVVTAALRRRALERLRAAANLKLDKPAPRAAPKEAWESFAKDIDGAASVLEAKPRASPKDAWGNFAKEGNAEGEGKGGGAKKKHP